MAEYVYKQIMRLDNEEELCHSESGNGKRREKISGVEGKSGSGGHESQEWETFRKQETTTQKTLKQ